MVETYKPLGAPLGTQTELISSSSQAGNTHSLQKQKEGNTSSALKSNALPSPRIDETCFFGGWHTAFLH